MTRRQGRLIGSARNVAELDTGTNTSCVAHDVGDVVLFVDTLEEMGLRSTSKDGHIVTTMSLGS